MTLESFLNISETTYLRSFNICHVYRFALQKNDITPIQFNAKTLKMVSHFFRKRILMTFEHMRETFLLTESKIKIFFFSFSLPILMIAKEL